MAGHSMWRSPMTFDKRTALGYFAVDRHFYHETVEIRNPALSRKTREGRVTNTGG